MNIRRDSPYIGFGKYGNGILSEGIILDQNESLFWFPGHEKRFLPIGNPIEGNTPPIWLPKP
jgi:hypothetical protein